eukprot:7450639-Alexandrium_andersonii.AAC.1
MSASLVGSEMCIRDRPVAARPQVRVAQPVCAAPSGRVHPSGPRVAHGRPRDVARLSLIHI